MAKFPTSGTLLVTLLLGVAALATGLTWRHYQDRNPSTRDAVLILPPRAAAAERETEPTARNTAPNAAAERELLEQRLTVAEAERVILREGYLASHEAIEEALQMVRDQRENFDFAHDRYERLMPLVETGALDPLSASQIQSAYISARASLAQANFYLGQARRAFGPKEVRAARMELANRKVERAREELAGLDPVAAPDSGASSAEPPPERDAPRQPIIEARFDATQSPVHPGMRAWVTLPRTPAANNGRLQATVLGTEDGVVFLELAESPELPPGRRFFPCHVTIDTTFPATPVREAGAASEAGVDG